MSSVITERALLGRIRRNFAKDGMRIRRGIHPIGPHERQWLYVDDATGTITGATDDLEKLGREIGVLKPGESVAS